MSSRKNSQDHPRLQKLLFGVLVGMPMGSFVLLCHYRIKKQQRQIQANKQRGREGVVTYDMAWMERGRGTGKQRGRWESHSSLGEWGRRGMGPNTGPWKAAEPPKRSIKPTRVCVVLGQQPAPYEKEKCNTEGQETMTSPNASK